MLLLSRKLGEKLFLGPEIVVTVVDIDRGKIRLGVEAPRDVPVMREEIRPDDWPPPESDWRRRALDAEEFKRWAHGWLDGAGVPHDPYPEHTAASGCRVSGRLGWLLRRAEKAEAENHRLKLACDVFEKNSQGAAELFEENRKLKADLERLERIVDLADAMADDAASDDETSILAASYTVDGDDLRRLRDALGNRTYLDGTPIGGYHARKLAEARAQLEKADAGWALALAEVARLRGLIAREEQEHG